LARGKVTGILDISKAFTAIVGYFKKKCRESNSKYCEGDQAKQEVIKMHISLGGWVSKGYGGSRTV
jgi:hypothetical protein